MITGRQILEARSLLGLTRSDLASQLTVVGAPSLKRIEMFDELPLSAQRQADDIQRVLEGLGIEFLNHGAQGVRLRKVEAS